MFWCAGFEEEEEEEQLFLDNAQGVEMKSK
jgi:hypothetical protein